MNYEIVDFVELDVYPEKVDGFVYDDESFLAVRDGTPSHDPDRSHYGKILESVSVVERIRAGEVHEVWLWGGTYYGFDELAMYIPKRYARFAPTDNPWFYRPYDIPEEVGRTVWVMGFNYEVGADNMIHSYTHRVESILALQVAEGRWDKALRNRDPWNTYFEHHVRPPGASFAPRQLSTFPRTERRATTTRIRSES